MLMRRKKRTTNEKNKSFRVTDSFSPSLPSFFPFFFSQQQQPPRAVEMQYDYSIWVPACPAQTRVQTDGTAAVVVDAARTSSAVVCGGVALLAVVLGTLVSVRYSSVVVYTQRVTTQGISNTLWLLFFVATAAKYGALALYYGFAPHLWVVGDVTDIVSCFSHALATLGCALALNHHLCFRPSCLSDPSRSSLIPLTTLTTVTTTNRRNRGSRRRGERPEPGAGVAERGRRAVRGRARECAAAARARRGPGRRDAAGRVACAQRVRRARAHAARGRAARALPPPLRHGLPRRDLLPHRPALSRRRPRRRVPPGPSHPFVSPFPPFFPTEASLSAISRNMQHTQRCLWWRFCARGLPGRGAARARAWCSRACCTCCCSSRATRGRASCRQRASPACASSATTTSRSRSAARRSCSTLPLSSASTSARRRSACSSLSSRAMFVHLPLSLHLVLFIHSYT